MNTARLIAAPNTTCARCGSADTWKWTTDTNALVCVPCINSVDDFDPWEAEVDKYVRRRTLSYYERIRRESLGRP